MHCVHADTVTVACVRAGAINALCTCDMVIVACVRAGAINALYTTRYDNSGMCASRCDQCIVYMQIRQQWHV